jgi:hypothetical protein
VRRVVPVLTLVLLLPACYHATVNTGLRPGSVTIEQPWAQGWVYGLVPPPTVETMEQCPAGVAQVETQHSFLNMLVGGLTFGIFTPMEITVTCAAGDEEDLPEAKTRAEAEKLLDSGEPFLIRLH